MLENVGKRYNMLEHVGNQGEKPPLKKSKKIHKDGFHDHRPSLRGPHACRADGAGGSSGDGDPNPLLSPGGVGISTTSTGSTGALGTPQIIQALG